MKFLKTKDEKEDEEREKEAAIRLLAECNKAIAEHIIKERYWQRRNLEGAREATIILGKTQADLEDRKKFRDFLKEEYKI